MSSTGEQLTHAWPGNKLAVRHGASSPSIIAERAEAIHGNLLAIAPWLDVDMFVPATNRYLHAAAVESLLDEYVQRIAAEKGVERISFRVFEQLNASRRLAARLASDLGLDPLGHSRILALKTSADVAGAGLDRLIAQGRQVIATRFPDGLPPLHSSQDDDDTNGR
jgi:hypothetical protein